MKSEKKIGDYTTTVIKYKKSPLTFTIDSMSSSYYKFAYGYVMFSPKFDQIQSSDRSLIDFVKLKNNFADWLAYHVREYIDETLEVDLWSEFKKNSSSLDLNNIDFEDKESFTRDEQRQIGMALDELKLLINSNFNTTKKQQSEVTKRLDYLTEASKRLNKFDWKSIAISTMISISIALTLDSEQGQLLFSLFKKVFSTLKLIMGN